VALAPSGGRAAGAHLTVILRGSMLGRREDDSLGRGAQLRWLVATSSCAARFRGLGARIGHSEPQMTASRRAQPHMVTASKIETVQHFCSSQAITCGFNEWGGWGSNPRPTDYESAALTG
jgi:hypothetical protein